MGKFYLDNGQSWIDYSEIKKVIYDNSYRITIYTTSNDVYFVENFLRDQEYLKWVLFLLKTENKIVSYDGMQFELSRVSKFEPDAEGRLKFSVDKKHDAYETRVNKSAYVGALVDKLNKQQKQKESKMKDIMEDLKDYLKKHKACIYTIAFILILDHFFLGGKLRGKVEELATTALDALKGRLSSGKE